MRRAALALLALALTGCQTTAEKSASLERAALQRAKTAPAAAKGLSIARASTALHVISTAALHSSEGIAAEVTVRNGSDTPQESAPLAIAVRSAGGSTLYSNASPGLAHSLISLPLVPAHGTATWVDDQVEGSGTPTSVTATVGEGQPARGALPQIKVSGRLAAQSADTAEVQGTVTNSSSVEQKELVVYAVLTRGKRIVAAGRSVLAQLAAHASGSFQIFLIGADAAGAQLQLSAPPTSID